MRSLIFTIFFWTFATSSISMFGQKVIPCDDKVFNDHLLERLAGNWTVTGNIGGDKIVYAFTAGWELNHQFIALTFADTARLPQYTAKVYIGYDCASARYVAHWLDNFGGRFSETLGYGVKSGDSIEFHFEYPDGPLINKFSYSSQADAWQFHATTKNSKGAWVVFGDMFLKRVQ
ncbi:MAG: hypothetical protein ACOYNC_10155 [Bacteroidales bacterium]